MIPPRGRTDRWNYSVPPYLAKKVACVALHDVMMGNYELNTVLFCNLAHEVVVYLFVHPPIYLVIIVKMK